MTSKAERRRRRKAARAALASATPPQPQHAVSGPYIASDSGPTPERQTRGLWINGNYDAHHDEIARLYAQRKLTPTQEQAARSFEELHTGYLAEYPELTGYKSCLAGGSGGYDGGDGNPAVIAEYRRAVRKVGMLGERELVWVCVEKHPVRRLDILRAALDALAG